uniref:Protein kinase domain-containing protein n=1 Tax=Macrostomum lignano TaxID=282301 RepID=A0A1I8F5G3_9PLAT
SHRALVCLAQLQANRPLVCLPLQGHRALVLTLATQVPKPQGSGLPPTSKPQGSGLWSASHSKHRASGLPPTPEPQGSGPASHSSQSHRALVCLATPKPQGSGPAASATPTKASGLPHSASHRLWLLPLPSPKPQGSGLPPHSKSKATGLWSASHSKSKPQGSGLPPTPSPSHRALVWPPTPTKPQGSGLASHLQSKPSRALAQPLKSPPRVWQCRQRRGCSGCSCRCRCCCPSSWPHRQPTALAGARLRLRARVGRVFIRRPPSPPPPRTEVPVSAAGLASGVVEGVPLAGDVGVHLVPALGATVEVLDGPAAGNATGGCSCAHPTMAAVLVDADPRQLGPAGLCRLLRDLSLRLRVRIASLEQVRSQSSPLVSAAQVSPDRTAVSGGQAARPPLYMLASGPGSANLAPWSPGRWAAAPIDARHLLALERLERLAMTGDLTGWPVLLWYVADRLTRPPTGARRDSPAAGIRLRGTSPATCCWAGRVGAADAEGSGAFLPPQYAGGVGQSGGGGAAGTTASTSSWAGLTSSTAPPTTTTPGLPLRRANQEFGSRQYLFPVDQVTRVPVPRDTVLERATGRGLEALASSVQNCGTLNSLLWPLRPAAKLQLVGRPTRRHIGVALSCRLVVEDRAGARIFIGFNVRVPEPLPPVPLPQQQTFSFSLGLPFSE